MYGCRADLGMVFWGSYTQGGRKSEVGSRKSDNEACEEAEPALRITKQNAVVLRKELIII